MPMTPSLRSTIACVAAFATLLLPGTAAAMEHNLALPWTDRCSGPQTPFLSFSSPQAENLLFASGEAIDIVCQAGLRSVALRWTLHRNGVDKPFRQGEAEPLMANRFRVHLATAGLHPGFYDLRVELDSGPAKDDKDLLHRPATGICTFGWKAEAMAIAQSRPADFAAFWAKAKAELAKIPLDAREAPLQTFDRAAIDAYNVASACLPADFDPAGHRAETVESGKVSLAGPAGGRVYAWLAKPVGKGPFPAMLVLPGGGFAPRPRPLEHARHGYLALDIQVHGQEVDQPKYENIDGHFANVVHEPVEKHYYYNVHLRCLQALNYLASRPDVDASRIVVVGGSQGGRLSIVLAGLDPRIRAAVPAIAHFSNQAHLRWVTRCNGFAAPGDHQRDPALAITDGMECAGAPPLVDDAISRCMAYYDPMNFAVDAKCAVMFNAGLIDGVSPPYGIFASFARWGGADKTMVALDGLGHDWCAQFDRQAFRWLDKVLAAPKP